MNKKTWFVMIGFALLLTGYIFVTLPDGHATARSLSNSKVRVVVSSEQHVALETVTFDVPSMTCASCPFIVTKTLKNIPGVTEATADLDTKTTRVVFDKNKTNIPALLNALKNRGYPSSVRDSS